MKELFTEIVKNIVKNKKKMVNHTEILKIGITMYNAWDKSRSSIATWCFWGSGYGNWKFP